MPDAKSAFDVASLSGRKTGVVMRVLRRVEIALDSSTSALSLSAVVPLLLFVLIVISIT